MKALLFDARPIPNDHADHAELLAWIAGLGFEPSAISPYGAIVDEAGGWVLYLHRQRRDADGGLYVDKRRKMIASDPISVRLGADPSWPRWLGEVVWLPDMPGEHVIEVAGQAFTNTSHHLQFRYERTPA